MENKNYYIHPFVRITFLLCAFTGSILCDNVLIVFAFYLTIIVPLFFLQNKIFTHLKFLLLGVVPIFLSFILLNIIVLQSKSGGWEYIFERVLRLTVYASIFQIVLTIPANDLFNTFKKWGLKGESLVTVISAFAVWSEITNRADKIVTARLSKGYVKRRNIFSMAMQFPYTLNPLIIGVIRTAVERADSWHNKNILNLIDNYIGTENKYNLILNTVIVIISISYLCVILFLVLTKYNFAL